MAASVARTVDDQIGEWIARSDEAFDASRNFRANWDAQRRLFLPEAAPIMSNTLTQGARDRQSTVDTYGAFVNRLHATFLFGALINQDGTWIKCVDTSKEPNDSPMMRQWLDDTRDALIEVAMDPSTGFVDAFYSMLLQYGMGSSALYGGDRPGRMPIVKAPPMRDLAWEENEDGEADGFFWPQSFTAAQARKKLGDAAGPQCVKDSQDNRRRNKPSEFLHVVVENDDWNPRGGAIGQRRYCSIWINRTEKHLCAKNFLTSNPYTAFRAPRRPGEVYGRGSWDEAFEEALMAQRVRIAVIRSMEKAIDPVMLLPDDGVSTAPTNEPEGAIVVRADLMARAGDPIRYLQSQGRPDLGQEWLSQSVYGAMDRAFGREFMTLPREPRMVNSQIIGLQEEQSRMTVPMVSPLYQPLGRFLARLYDIRHRQGRMPKPPAGIERAELGIEFRNPLAHAARLAEVRAFMQALEIAVNAGGVDPGARYALKVIEGVQDSARTLGVPEKYISTKEEIEKALEAAANVNREKSQMEGALDLSTVMKNVGAGARGLRNERQAA